MDIRLALMTGVDIPVPECQLILHQPTIQEISYLGETDFFAGVQTLTLHKSMFAEEDKTVLNSLTNFQIFMTIVNEKETADKKEAVKQVLSLLFPTSKIMFTPMSIIFNDDMGSHIVDDNNFEDLQHVLRLIFCTTIGPMDQQSFNPANEQARQIAEKLMRGRQRVAAQNENAGSSIFSTYLSGLSIGTHYDLRDLCKLTMYQLFDLMERYSLWMNWDIDLRVRMAGGKPDTQPENWMKNIH